MPNATESRIKSRIAEFVQELDALVRKSTLDALKGALEGHAAPARRGRPAGSGRGPGRPRGPALVEGCAEAIVAHVKSNDAQTVGDIVTAVGAKPAAVKKAIKDLLASGALKKSGQKRGTRYHVGSGRAPAKAKEASKRRGRKTKRKAKAKQAAKPGRAAKPKRKRRAAPRRKTRLAKKVVVIPARKRPAAATQAVAPRPAAGTDVPQALAAG